MVFDATTRAFSLSESTNAHSPHASTSTTASPAPPGTTTRPTKRRRVNQSGTVSSTPTPSPAPTPIIDLDALDAARRRAAGRVLSLWESLAEKYARPIEEDDEIDILTGKICRDRGVLRSVSERGWKIGSFGEALEVEPLVLVSEGETETGTSEADDEGEVEDDTEGDRAEDTEEGEEDPLGSWSYDWQYRVLPPPRPELSPQDAEDLKEFLAVENAIQENRRKNGTQPESEDDDIVYLGDSLHNMDGTLRGDETSDDEFASMAMTDSSTIRYMKCEDEEDDEADDIEPMASILGALALGRTPRKQSLHPSSPQPKDEEMLDDECASLSSPSKSNAPSRSYPDGGSQANAARPSTGTSAAGLSALDVDDDIIVIDSDSDDEREPMDNSGMKPGIASGSPSKLVSQTQRASSDVTAIKSPSKPSTYSRSPATQLTQTPKLSVATTTTLLEPSVTQQSSSNTKRIPPLLHRSPVPNPATAQKYASKRVLGKSAPRLQAPGSGTTATNSPPRGSILDARLPAMTSTPIKNESNQTSETDPCVESPKKRTNETPFKAAKRKATKPSSELKEKPAPSQGTTCADPPSKVNVSSPKASTIAPVISPSLSTQPKSPVKRRKKATVVEVVLPVSRKLPKVKRESTVPLPPTPSKDTALASPATAPAPSERSHPQPDRSALNSEQLDSTPATTLPLPDTSLVVRSGVELGLKRKRLLGGDEHAENEGNALESQTSVESVGFGGPGPLHTCCPSTPLGRNQSAVCCPAHPGLHLHAQSPRSALPSCSTHTHLGVPVYQHQHQHQHLHTHLPYPLPQLPFTANELTEAALKLIHGLSTFQASGTSGPSGGGFWFPGAQLPFGFAIPGQAGPSSQALSPKLEEPSSQEKTTNECIPSSQEYERKAEAVRILSDEKPSQVPHSLPRLEGPARTAPSPSFETHAGKNETTTASVVTPSDPPYSKLSPPEREMSVIDIESDSDDELAVCDAGAGSMRWELPVKKEVDLGDEEEPQKQSRPRESSVNGRMSSRTSPVKLKKVP
ncbi:unnamed protein product [Rhizoctonia solani]|uniref:Centromere protein Scm3 n=1 Tax=Rhizoctonia solani TaxID=456999 RepID=A0A8H2WSR9_9AGAM|nr:unnamed protein product [Rhizoctonia solani]